MAQDVPDQPIASTSAPSSIEETEAPQLTLPLVLDTIIEAYESQRVQLADTCWQIDEIILRAENLSDPQHHSLHDWYIASVEDAAARCVLTIGQGRQEGGDCREATPREAGDEAAEPPRMSRD